MRDITNFLCKIFIFNVFVCCLVGPVRADCTEQLRAFTGAVDATCKNYIADLLENASAVRSGLPSEPEFSASLEFVRDFHNTILKPTLPAIKFDFDGIVKLLHDLNVTGIKTGLCERAQWILAPQRPCAQLYKQFSLEFFERGGLAYYEEKQRLLGGLERHEKGQTSLQKALEGAFQNNKFFTW